MTLQQLCYIVTIVNCGSIPDAVKQLFMTQPSLSNTVKELEEGVGISIFNRSSKGIVPSSRGMEFLSYTRQILEQAELPGQHYTSKKSVRRICSVSTQHHAFVVDAPVNSVSRQSMDGYKFTLRETRIYEIIDDVKNYRSELGILYINDSSREVLEKLFKESGLVSHLLFRVSPHILISISHPLSARKYAIIEGPEDYPFLTFEQGKKNPLYLSEEMPSTIPRRKVIYVSDRATLPNPLIGLNGYVICSGILSRNLNDDFIMTVPLETEDNMFIGWITNPRTHLDQLARKYPEELNWLIGGQPQNKSRVKTPSAGIRIRMFG